MKSWLTKIQHSLGIVLKHKDDQVGLFIPHRQASWLFSLLLILGFVCFILGYFWGHRRAIQRFVAKIEEESFADRINYALYTMNDRDMSEFEQEDTSNTSESTATEDINGGEEQEENGEDEASNTEKQVPEDALESSKQKEQVKTEVTSAQPTTVFVAPLAGFGTLLAATQFAQRVKIFDPQVAVQKRESKTKRGRAVTWYQVTTGEFESKQDLQKITSTIQQREHIKTIDIIEKRKG